MIHAEKFSPDNAGESRNCGSLDYIVPGAWIDVRYALSATPYSDAYAESSSRYACACIRRRPLSSGVLFEIGVLLARATAAAELSPVVAHGIAKT